MSKKKDVIIFDIDGTLADVRHRRHLAEAKQWDEFHGLAHKDTPTLLADMADMITSHMWFDWHHPIVITGRPERMRAETKEWIDSQTSVTDDYKLFMRPEGDKRPDHEIKQEIYKTHIEPFYNVKLVFEDRSSVVKMWRSLGLTCWQVAEGDF